MQSLGLKDQKFDIQENELYVDNNSIHTVSVRKKHQELKFSSFMS